MCRAKYNQNPFTRSQRNAVGPTSNTLSAAITAVHKKHLSTEYNMAQPDGSTAMDVINASFALCVKKRPREEVVEERAATMILMTMILK